MSAPEVFSEWDTYAERRQLIEREIKLEPIIDASSRKIVTITGIRRCGKSSLLMLMRQRLSRGKKRSAYINLEDSRLKLYTSPLEEVIKWFGDEGTLLLDEVTAAPDYQGWLARTHEMTQGRLRIITTSSRNTLLKPSRPLRGRLLPYELYPLSFPEFLRFKKIEDEPTTAGRGRVESALLEYLKFGGFPGVCLTEDETEKVATLSSYIRDIVGLDIAEVSGVDLSLVRAFSEYALQTPLFSASKTLTYLKNLGYKIGKDRILNLEKDTEASYLVHYTQIYSHNIKDKSQYPRKAYPGDTGFTYALRGVVDLGRLLENVVLLELKRRHSGITQVNYWKNSDGVETDFVVRRGNYVKEAIQVCHDLTDQRTRRRELAGLTKCARELKVEEATILTNGPPDEIEEEGVRIKVKSVIDWLRENPQR